MTSYDEYVKILYELCAIPAPSHHEEKRAEYLKRKFECIGAETVYIDEALNVVFPYGCDGSDDITLLMAHTDTVFPETVPLKPKTEDGLLYCPGSGDDTANVVVLLAVAEEAIRMGRSKGGILFVANSCEEGLGNLKGCRQIMNDYAGRIKRVISFDGDTYSLTNGAVGSHRYEITVKTEGGHSFSKFGKPNAIAIISELICRLYEKEVPKDGDSTTTYNVGVISGGTSVNAIAQTATMLYEYRSDSNKCLMHMKEYIYGLCGEFKERGIDITLDLIGERPCSGDVDACDLKALTDICAGVMSKHFGTYPFIHASSTDCNIPLSLGIPAVAFGTVVTAGAHTKEEYVVLDSLRSGIEAGKELLKKLYER